MGARSVVATHVGFHIPRSLAIVFSFLFVVILSFMSLSVLSYHESHKNGGNPFLSNAQAQDAVKYDEDVYDEDKDIENAAKKAKEEREKELKDQREKVKKLADEYMDSAKKDGKDGEGNDKEGEDGEDKEKSEKDLFQLLDEKITKENDPTSFGEIIRRILGIGYLNKTPHASNHQTGSFREIMTEKVVEQLKKLGKAVSGWIRDKIPRLASLADAIEKSVSGDGEKSGPTSNSNAKAEKVGMPVDESKTTLTSGYGSRWGSFHDGYDFAGPEGTPIYAVADGEVVQAGPASGYGQWIIIRHKQKNGEVVDSLYGHMWPNSLRVKVGDKVKAGDHIADIGNNGFSTGAHLHFGIYPGGWSLGGGADPGPYLQNNSLKDSESVGESDTSDSPLNPNASDSGGSGSNGGNGTILRDRDVSYGDTKKAPQSAIDGKNCRENDPRNGTVMYHNCDVPNIMTQFLQYMVSAFVSSGPANAAESTAKVTNPTFGMPDDIPGDGAPVKPEERSNKYTGLELFGYSFRVTSYKGEWDDVRVQNSARALSGMGSFDRIRATFKSIAHGLGNATATAATNASKALSSGNVFGAMTGFYYGLVAGGISGTAESILDTSDQNVFNQNAWYRVDFGQTMYGARELSQEEIATEMQKLLVEYMGGTKVDEVEIPKELSEIEEVPEAPKEAISYCNYIPQSEATTPPPGATKEECEAAYQAALAASSGGAAIAPMKWTVDGTRKQEKLTDYRYDYPKARKNVPPDYFDVANRFGLMCLPEGTIESWDPPAPNSPENIAKRKEFYSKISSCWTEKWQEAVDNKLKVDQDADTAEKIGRKFDSDDFQAWVKENEQDRNYNGPWRRYICLNEDGTDMKDGDDFVFLYDITGTRNPRCKESRPPIQNGVFGNGYDYKSTSLNDTRYMFDKSDVASVAIPLNDVLINVSEFGINVASYATRISNTAMNFAYGTMLDKLGIEKMAEKTVEKLRDGVFFPLITFFAAFGALSIFLRTMRRGVNNKQASLELLMLGGIAIFGYAILTNPAKLIHNAEEKPAEIEQGLLSAIYSEGSIRDDQLCTVNGSSGVVANDKGRDTLSNDTLRRLMCENWRAGVYNVWVFTQFGVGPDMLDTNNMKNTNRSLVGDAKVNMGGGTNVNNWALYQLDAMTTGTASFDDPEKNTGKISKDFYRIVDMQAGPNNGAGRDGRYFDMWAGKKPVDRMITSLLGAAGSVMLALTVTTYSIAKIQLNITTLLLLSWLPVMLIYGLSPIQGRNKMRGYFATVIAVIIQRVTLTMLLGIIFRIMFGFGASSSNGIGAMLGMLMVSLIFFVMRKQILGVIDTSVRETVAQGDKTMSSLNKDGGTPVPGFAKSMAQRAYRGTNAVVGGAIGGFAAGGLSGAEPSMKRAWNSQMSRIRRLQRYRGKGVTQTFAEGVWRGKEEGKADLDRDPFVNDIKEAGHARSYAHRRYQQRMMEYKAFEGKERKAPNGSMIKVSPSGEVMKKPTPPKVNAASTKLRSGTTRKISARVNAYKKNLQAFDNKLKQQGISVSDNGTYYKCIAPNHVLQKAQKEALRQGESDWGQFVEKYNNTGKPIEFEVLSDTETRKIEQEFEHIENMAAEGVEKSELAYEKKATEESVKQDMKDALIEAREKAGKANSERGRFF